MFARSAFLRSLTRLAALSILAASGGVAAHAYDAIIVFGDSYNDVGNIAAAAAQYSIAYPSPPYYNGRFSNGPIWLDQVASARGLSMVPSLLGGTNYAFGGARLLSATTIDSLPIPSVLDQVALYLGTHGGKADPNALYVIEGGGNDIIGANSFDSAELGGAVADGLFGIEVALRAAGAKKFLIPDLLDVSQVPAVAAAGKDFARFAHDTSLYASIRLNQLLEAEPHAPGVVVYRIPIFHTFLAIANAQPHFGFTDVTAPCLLTSGLSVVSTCDDPVHHLWWDAEHPTTFAHAFIAVLVEGVLRNQ